MATNHSLKKGRAAPLEGVAGPIIGVLKLGLALATLGVLSKLSHKLAGPGPTTPGFGGSSFAKSGPSTAIPSGNTRPVFAAPRSGFAGPNLRSGPSTPRPR